MSDLDEIECCTHGKAIATYVCAHLIDGSNSEWFSGEPDADDQWPDAWCGRCHAHFLAEGEWNDVSETAAKADGGIKLLCHHCYSRIRSSCNLHVI
jgi:hypothetical protein